MAEEENKNLIPEGDGTDVPAEDNSAAEAQADASAPASDKKSRSRKEAKEAAKEEKKELSRYKKEWEDSLVSAKRVKREELRRKWRKALLVMLVISLLTTSIVYIMLLFIEENNIRITASSNEDQSISLSFDKQHWSPYLDVDGPTEMGDVSYNKIYGDKHVDIPTLREMETLSRNLLVDPTTTGGDWSKKDVIQFSFYLENSCEQDVPIYYEMRLTCNDKGLENSIRVVWAESYNFNDPQTSLVCYAARSDNERLTFSTTDGLGKIHPDGGVEFVSYPMGSDNPETWDRNRYAQFFVADAEYDMATDSYNPYVVPNEYKANGESDAEAKRNFKNELGYVPTVPFAGNDTVFAKENTLNRGDMLCVYVCIWIEGSDLDCVDSAIGGYVTLSINFAVA